MPDPNKCSNAHCVDGRIVIGFPKDQQFDCPSCNTAEKTMTEQDGELAYSIEEMASQIFTECGAEDDYCVQSIGWGSIVFGGTNRLILDKNGWRLDESYCTLRFIDQFNKRVK